MANVIEVEAGGKVFEFPADTSRDVMLRALRQHFGLQEPAAQPTITQPPVTPQPATLPQDFQIPVEAPPSVIPPVTQEEPLLPPEASIEQFVRGRPAEATAYTPTMLQRIAELLPGDKARSLNEYIARQIARERKIPITQVYEEIGGARPIFNPEGRAPVTAGIEAAGVVAKEIPEIPAGVGTTLLRAYRAGEMPVVDESWVDKAIAAMDPMKDGKPDPNYSAFQGLGQSLGFSIANMVASITAGAGATTVTGGNPAAGVAAGMATSGTLAYRASKDEFLDRVRDKLNKQSKQLYGKPLSAEDWKAATEEFDSAATRYGLWEAIPEAVSNAIFLKAFSSPARGLSANRLAEVGNKAGALAAEQATETITALGQNAEERKAGLTNEELSIVGAFRQQFIQTLLISGTMAGGMKGKQLATDFYQNYVEPRIDPASALGRAIQADLESVGFSAAGIDQAARASLATDQSLASRARAEATIKRMRQLAVPPAEEPPAEEPGERVEPTIGEIPAPGGRAEPTIGELPPSEGVEPGLGEPAAPAAAPTAPAAPAGIGMPEVEEGEPTKTTGPAFQAPPDFLYTITQAPSYEGQVPLSVEDADFFLESLIENAKRGRLTEVQFAQSEIGSRLDTAQLIGIYQGFRVDPVGTLEALRASLTKPVVTTTPPSEAVTTQETQAAPAAPAAPAGIGMPDVEEEQAAAQPPVAQDVERPGYVRVYHSGSVGEGESGRWVSTDKRYASNYRKNLPLFFTYVREDDPRVNNPDYPDEQGVKQGFVFNFELTPEEAANLQEIPRTEIKPVVTTTPPAKAVTTEETKPAPAAVVANSATEGIPIVYPLVSALRLSNDVPQFKEDADQKGVVNRLTGKFDWRDFGAIQVWQRLNGDLEVISGRHRLDLAQRSRIERVPAQIYREADGFTAQDAAILDAELNIRDEKGTVKDYVQYFKGSGITQEEAQSRGLLDNVKGTRAFAIANFGSPELVAAHSARQLSDEAAAQIALAAPQDSRLQAVGLKVRQDGKSDEAAVNAVRAVKAIAREQNTTTDMFGFDDSLIKEAVEMAKIAERKQKELSNRIAVLSKVSKNPKIAEQEGIDIKDPKAVAARIQELKDLRAAWNNWETNPDLINEIRQERGAFELTAETEEQRAAREAEEEAARRAEAEAAAEAERKAKADRERGEFVLTGSDRPVDEAEARGQGALFGAPAEPAQGDVVASQDLPDNMQARVVKTSDGYASLLFDKDSNNVVNGSVTRFTGEDALSRATTSFNDLAAKATPAEPEPGTTVDENDPGFRGASDQEVKDVAQEFKEAAARQDEGTVTRVFDPPKKDEVVRLENKTRVFVKGSGYLTLEQARQRIEEWKKNAQAQGETRKNSDKVVLSLFDMTGEWSKPWEEAGYQVYRFDIQTDPEFGDVNKFSAEFFNDMYGAFEGQDVYAILAACPCTDFASSGARHFAAKDADGRTVESVQLVQQTLATIEYFKPSVWAIENPVGRIEKLTGLPPWRLSFNPNHFGDPYTKKTLLWGRFNADLPIAPVEPTEGSKMHRVYGGKSQETKNARSVTPEGFAYAFFQANNAIDNPVMAIANKYDMMNRDVFEKALAAGMSENQISDIIDDDYYDQAYKDAETKLLDAVAEQTVPEAIEEVVEPVVEQAPVAQNLAEAQAAYDKAFDALNAHGSAPPKPSSEKKYFGERGRAGASPEEVAKYDAQVKAYNAWKRKYNKLKKAEVDAANNLERARQADQDAKNGAASPDQAINESQAIDTTVKGQLEAMAKDFMVGDQVRFGNMPGVVIGLEGDSVRFRPDAARSPKAYQKVPKSSLTFVSRPDTTSQVSYSKEQDNKFGDEAGALNADKSGLIQLLGANMYQSALADVSIKELLQNAFDAVKGAASTVNSQGNKITPLYKEGKIEVEIDAENRTITIRDNARGMTPEIVRNAFFTIAGSDKSDLPPELRSGGFGFAKMGFMLGSESLKLDTVRDGVRVTVDTTAKDIAADNFTIKKVPAPKGEHGTSITVKIPDKYLDRNGEAKDIYFPYSLEYIEPLNKPLIGPVEVTATLKAFGDKETKVLPIGVNFPKDKFTKFKANFDWGSADIYFSIDRNAGKGWNIKHQVLSSGVYQFNPEFMLNNEKIPYDIIVDVKPNVTARDPNYPFENSRERFKGRLKKDIDALTLYLGQIARGYEARDLQESFKGVVSMPRIEAGAEIAGTAEKLKKSFGVQGAAKPAELKPLPKEVTVTADAVQDTVTQKVLVDVKAKEAEKQKEATFKAEKAPKSTDFMIELKQDPKLPMFHNNTNVDFVEIGRAYGEPEKFFAELGTLMVEMKEDLAKSGFYGYDKLSPDNLFFAGVSIDKQYGGVHIRVPYKALFVNPFYEWGARTLFGVRQNLLNTMIHEIAHTGDMDHGEVHNGQIIKVEQYLADEGLLDYYRDALLDLLRRHESTFTAMKEAYGKSTTRNTAKSLKDYGKDAAAASTRGAGDGRQDQAGAVPAGGRPGRGEGVPGAAVSRAEEEPTGTGEARREQVDALLQEFDRPEVPSRDTKLAQRTLLPSGSKLKQFYSGLATSNGRAADGLIGPLHRGMAAIRNKLFFSGAALEEADARRYGRMVVTPNDLATATLAVDNMLHGGGIAVEFIARGGIEYNPQTKRIQAVQAPTSMLDVYRAEKSLKDELGTKRAEGLINGYLEAKRSRSIRDEMESLGQDIQTVEADLQTADNDLQTLLQNPASTKQAINAKTKQVDQLKQKLDGLRTQLDDITQINDEKVLMDDAEIDAFIAQENDFPQLRQIMDAWTDTNRRLLGLMRQVRLISQDRYDRLVNIKDYVPWQRVMDDEGDIHGPAPSRSVTRIPKERVFKRGKVERPVEYIIDNMTNNIIRLTMNSLRQYAAGRIVSEYATRNEKGQIKTFPKEDRDKNRFPYIIDGRRTIVEIKDPLIAEAVYGSDSVDLRMNAALAAATNFMRRVITVDPFFQAAQVVKDAPTAAIVTGVKNPVALMSRVMTSFAGTVLNTDPVADILRANGIGGFQSIARTPEKRLKQKIGIATMSVPEATMALLDHIGDASDFAARMAAYKQVMKETGNEAEALNRAANVINFNRLGSSRIVRQFIRYVNFANAYLQSIDTLVTALTGRGMRGRNTKAALAVAANAMIQLTGLSLLYSFLVGGDDEYQKLDDQTKARNFFIPSTITKQLGLEKGILIPMNTSAAFFFKALPELTYQAFVNSATKSDFDATRYRKAVAEAAADALLGPEPVPSAIRPIVEIGMNRSFFTEKSLTPRGMETLEKSRQFTDATSEIAKKLGEFGGLSPIEWDHLIRGTTGVAGMMVQQASNMIGEHLNTRPETPAEKLPGIGRFIAPEEGRNREALFYDLHERIRKATSTLKDLEETGEFEKAEKYEKEKESLLGLSAWSNRTEARLKKINEEIRLLSRGKEEGTARARRRTIRELQREKNERLEGIEEMRAKEAGL